MAAGDWLTNKPKEGEIGSTLKLTLRPGFVFLESNPTVATPSSVCFFAVLWSDNLQARFCESVIPAV